MASTDFTNGVTQSDAGWFDDVDTAAYSYLTGVAGTNTITATGPVSMTAYASGQIFRFIPAATNTGATTINITANSVALGAKNIFANGAACVGGELQISVPTLIVYDGTQFHVIGPFLGKLGGSLNTAYAADWEGASPPSLLVTNANTTVNAYAGIRINVGANSQVGMNAIRTADGAVALAFGSRISGSRIENFRMDPSGRILVGKTTQDESTAGAELHKSGKIQGIVSGDYVAWFNRNTSDGTIVNLAQDGSIEGTISVSGTTVSYNAFLGSHWSQLADGSRADILPGTVMQTIDQLCVWPGEENDRLPRCEVCDTADSDRVYGVFLAWDEDEFRDVPATEDVEEEYLDVREVDGRYVAVRSTRTVRVDLFERHPIFNEDGTPHMVMVQPPEVENGREVAPAVYEQATHSVPVMVKRQGVNDMYVAAIGQYRVRLRRGETFKNGDLVVAAGGGCAKVRSVLDTSPLASKVIGKINCAVVIETYPDGSFTVPCALYCG